MPAASTYTSPRIASMVERIVSSMRRTSAMVDDGTRRARRGSDGAALTAFVGVVERLLIGALADAPGPRTPTDSRALFIIVNI